MLDSVLLWQYFLLKKILLKKFLWYSNRVAPGISYTGVRIRLIENSYGDQR
jgi:hypothetical protein